MKDFPPFDLAQSMRLDLCIVRLEADPKRPDRYWLRWQKRLLERAIPPLEKQIGMFGPFEQLQLIEVRP